MVLALALWVGMFWWIAMSDRLYRRITNLLSQLPVISLATCLLAAMFVADLTIGLYPLPLRLLHPGVLAGVAAGALGTFALLLSAREPREALRIAALMAGSSVVALILAECLLSFLARPYVRTEREFTEMVAASWPRPISIEKSPGTFRILGLADSFGRVGGFSNFHYVLEWMLRSQFGPGIEVVNLSVEGYEPRDQLDMLQRFGARYQPDLVLHGFFVGNDFWTPRYPLVRVGWFLMRPVEEWRRYRPKFFLIKEWIREYAIAMRDLYRKRGEAAHGKEVGTFSEQDFLRIEAVRVDSCCYRDPEPAVRWQETMEVLKAIWSEADQMGARYVMVIHPDQIQVEDALRQQVFQAGDLFEADYDLGLPQTFLMADCVRNGLACLDLLHTFRTNGAEGGLYLLRDTHYNETGNRLAATEILRFLLDQQIIPSSGRD
jgi:hypothetical protein